jgi:F420-dependent oxidoreductase-like protein
LKLGAVVVPFEPWEQVVRWAREVEELGLDSLWVPDHLVNTIGSKPFYEGWTTLAALAQATRRARIGTLVNGNTYRHPCVTAKMAATLDHLSGGRLNLGIGAGWFELEHRAFGIDFKTVPQRLAALEEALQIIRGMLTQERTTVQGRHYRVTDAIGLPKPVQKPYPPIMIGGTGPRVLLRIVAQYADMWNASASTERMQELIAVIARHGERVDRDPAKIEKTVLIPFSYRAAPEREQFLLNIVANMRQTTPEAARRQAIVGGKDECLETIARYVAAGVTHFIFMLIMPQLDEVQAFAEEVAPAARAG